jgi:GTP diphosphokinase / guanosine-3',5'-bis(diphosphate) 3'-diphosphatase
MSTTNKMFAKMLNDAIVIATNAHTGQFDKGGNPYILHVLAVMHKLRSDDLELKCIAALHDTVEDTDVTYAQLIDAGMSERVVAGVRALTKQRGQTYDEYKAGVFANVDAMHVKQKDLMHNSDIRRLKGVSEKDIARVAKYMVFYTEINARLKESV